jgi:uncharacterized membrane protein YciS (DUF1049 family)
VKRVLIWVVSLVAFVGFLWTGWTFRANNSLSNDLDLIWVQYPNVELWWLLLLAMSFGAGITALILGFAWLRARLLLRKYRSNIRRLEKEVHELRSLPLVGSEPGSADLGRDESRSMTSPVAPVAERS